MSISVIIPTIGRPTLQRTIDSIKDQLEPGDEILIEFDFPPHRDDGNWCRDRMIQRAAGTHLWFMDDDDAALPGALSAFRRRIEEDPSCAWMFRIWLCGELSWKVNRITPGNQQGQCILVPRGASTPWSNGDGPSDWHYINRVRADIKWADDIIATIRPD